MLHLLAQINTGVAGIAAVLLPSGLRGFAPSRDAMNFAESREGREDAAIESHAT